MPDGDSYGAKLLRFWWPNGWAFLWLVLGLLPLFFFETFVHEGLHWLTAKIDGFDPKLIPFAHFNSDPFFNRDLNGITLNTGDSFIATPQLVCLGFMLGLIAVFIFTSPPWRWLRSLLTWWYLGLILDLLFNTLLGAFDAERPGTDWARFADGSGHGLATFFSWVIVTAVLSQLLWSIWSRWNENRPSDLGFFEFRWLAIPYAFVSLIAVILSWTIDDPTVVRDWWFWMIWLAQLASLIWYLAYTVWATVRG
jgi:hypothetical protein